MTTSTDLPDARAALEQMLADLDASAATLRAEESGEQGSAPASDPGSSDTASEIEQLDRSAALLGSLAEQRAEIQAALERLADGTYGRCLDCGQPLPPERLQARPEAARCVADQARREGRR